MKVAANRSLAGAVVFMLFAPAGCGGGAISPPERLAPQAPAAQAQAPAPAKAPTPKAEAVDLGEPDAGSLARARALLGRMAGAQTEESARAGAELSGIGSGALPSLVSVALDGRIDRTERLAAVEAIGKIGSPKPGPALRRLLSDPDPEMRWYAARALGRVADGDSRDRLREALEDGDGNVRYFAASALVSLGDAYGLEYFRKELALGGELIRFRALKALESFPRRDQVVEIAALAVCDESCFVRARAIECLGRAGAVAAAPHLVRALDDADCRNRARALKLLEELSGERLGPAKESWEKWLSEREPAAAGSKKEPPR